MNNKSNRDKTIYFEMQLNARLSDVWNARTTKQGIRSFFSPDCFLELKVGRAY